MNNIPTQMTITPKIVLERVRALLTDPAHWTQGAFARDAENNSVHTNDTIAVKYCLLGAIHKVNYLNVIEGTLAKLRAEIVKAEVWEILKDA